MKKPTNDKQPTVQCMICGHRARSLVSHLNRIHHLTWAEYRMFYPDAKLNAPDLEKLFYKSGVNHKASYWNAFQKLLKECDRKTVEKIIKYAEKVSGLKVEDFEG